MSLIFAATIAGCATPDPESGVHDRAVLADRSLTVAIREVIDSSRLVNARSLRHALSKELAECGFTVTDRKADLVVEGDVVRISGEDRPAAADEGVYLQSGGQDRREYYNGGGADPLERGPRIRARIRINRSSDDQVVYEASFTTEVMGVSEDMLARVLAKPLKRK